VGTLPTRFGFVENSTAATSARRSGSANTSPKGGVRLRGATQINHPQRQRHRIDIEVDGRLVPIVYEPYEAEDPIQGLIYGSAEVRLR